MRNKKEQIKSRKGRSYEEGRKRFLQSEAAQKFFAKTARERRGTQKGVKMLKTTKIKCVYIE